MSDKSRAGGRGFVGGEPRASLLPAEIREERAAKSVRTGLLLGVAATVVVAGAATVGVFFWQMQTALQLEAARNHTTDLLQAQTEYGEIRQLRSDVTMVQAAQRIGVSTEIDWQDYLQQVQATLPAGVVITQLKLDSASPLAEYAQSTAPLQGERIATIAFTATSTTLPDVPRWLDNLATLPGYADALPGETTANEDGTWTVNITMHVGDAVFTDRFAPPEAEGDGEPASTENGGE
ncbi:hypothetical protein ET445_07010 [Agromyces protaetiae]|uniref:Fimbrial assembly protein n=1 Tax=Agromyces protaetiae TaxID=2509455 RepID=A0A4P6FAY0_9MICO|nr:hypothetical protein [Agromyces protaetiae]QAY73132.1 hypothetical protein ET445_07010 [Agromyces protaetiae]